MTVRSVGYFNKQGLLLYKLEIIQWQDTFYLRQFISSNLLFTLIFVTVIFFHVGTSCKF